MSNTLKEQLKGHCNMSQQAAIAAAVSPGQATFSLLQVRAALGMLKKRMLTLNPLLLSQQGDLSTT